MQFSFKVLHVLNPYLHAHLLSCGLVELKIAQETVKLPNMTLTSDRLTFQLSNSEEQLGNVYDFALSTLFSSPFGSVMVDLLSKLTLDLIGDLDLDKRGHLRWIYVCVLVRFNLYFSIWQQKCHFEKMSY